MRNDEPEKLSKEIGQRIANYRPHLSLSQAEMAEKYRTSKSVWSHYENGRRPLNQWLLIAFSDQEKLSIDAILKGVCKTERERLMIRHPSETWRVTVPDPQPVLAGPQKKRVRR